jgi:hypothetical protein
MQEGLERGRLEMSWRVAVIRAAVMLLAGVLLFAIVPDRLLSYLSTRIVPGWRDFLMLVYVGVAFVVACWLFVVLQRDRAG